MCTLSPPDAHGYCSYGISVDYTKPALEASKISIVQINEEMPRTLGDAFVHISQIDCIVEHTEPLIEIERTKTGDIERKIAGYCAELINDGACLQLGIGAIPDVILTFLKDKKDLGLHTEMFSDGVIDLIEAGTVNCAKKNFNRGRVITA